MSKTYEEKRTEAIERMKKFGLFPEAIKQFDKERLINISEPPFGALYWADGKDMKRIRDFEERENAVVYHVVRTFSAIGMMDSYLFVSNYPEEWNIDRRDIKAGKTLAYVYNHDAPECSEMGYIGVKLTPADGLCRVW